MNPNKYMEESVKLDRPDFNYQPIVDRLNEQQSGDYNLIRLIHASMGMSGETGEIMDTIKKTMMYGKELNLTNLKEECGDVLWYMSVMLHELGSSFEEVMEMNNAKLRKRYPQGFTEKDAIARADKNEKVEVV